MEPSKLTENISSDYVAAFNAMQPRAAAARVEVYVEGEEDIAFWRHILQPFEKGKIDFEIQAPTKKGKQQALEKSKDILSLKIGQYLIVCVDSDYDYLLPDSSPESRNVVDNPHIFHTYAYALENIQCFSDSLHNIVVQATKNDRKAFNYNDILRSFSQTVYPLLLWNLYFRSVKDHATFPLSQFCELVRLTDKVNTKDAFEEAFAGLRNRVAIKKTELGKTYAQLTKDVIALGRNLEQLGLNKDTAYLFVQGHTLKNNVVLMLLRPIYEMLVAEKFDRLRNDFPEGEERTNNINNYRNKRQDVAEVLDANTMFKDCFAVKKIEGDLALYVAKLKASA